MCTKCKISEMYYFKSTTIQSGRCNTLTANLMGSSVVKSMFLSRMVPFSCPQAHYKCTKYEFSELYYFRSTTIESGRWSPVLANLMGSNVIKLAFRSRMGPLPCLQGHKKCTKCKISEMYYFRSTTIQSGQCSANTDVLMGSRVIKSTILSETTHFPAP